MSAPTAEESRALLDRFSTAQLALGDGCGDGNCVVKRPKGMRTNGGCKCLYRPDHPTMQRAGQALRVAQDMAVALAAALDREAALRDALREIARSDEFDMLLDPTRASRIAHAALTKEGED